MKKDKYVCQDCITRLNQGRYGLAPSSAFTLLLMVISVLSGCAKPNPTDSHQSDAPARADEPLVELQRFDPRIKLDLRYATSNNFLGRPVYPEARCFVRLNVARQLKAVQDQLEERGVGLVVFDGYRPVAVQRAMWRIMPDPDYVADPAKGSRHNRGAAVDVALVDLDGKPLPMPTEFDDFTPAAHRDAVVKDPAARANRKLLTGVMQANGFVGLRTEWWHFDIENWRDYPIIQDDAEAARLKTIPWRSDGQSD